MTGIKIGYFSLMLVSIKSVIIGNSRPIPIVSRKVPTNVIISTKIDKTLKFFGTRSQIFLIKNILPSLHGSLDRNVYNIALKIGDVTIFYGIFMTLKNTKIL